ncbi:MAG: redoxin domain-containing protein [Nitrospinae bacterium]|nr:redoxin domain-containing protein [Nitrospinota bacterium]
MYYARLALILLAGFLASCGDMKNDLLPSGEDRSASAQTEETVVETVADFTLPDTLNRSVSLYETLAGYDGVVLYFTMWCPVCSAHMDHMLANVTPLYPNVKFFLVDYVSGSVEAARTAEVSNGYAISAFTTLVDVNDDLLKTFGATMGTTVVIDSSGAIAMKEDYKDGTALKAALEGLK